MLDFLLKLVVCRLKDPDADYPTSGAHTGGTSTNMAPQGEISTSGVPTINFKLIFQSLRQQAV